MQNLGTCFSGGHGGGGSRLRVTPEVFSTFNHPVIPRDRTRSQIRGPPVLFHLQPPRDWKGMKLDPSDSRPTPAPFRIPGHRAGGGSREPWRHRRARTRRRGGAGRAALCHGHGVPDRHSGPRLCPGGRGHRGGHQHRPDEARWEPGGRRGPVLSPGPVECPRAPGMTAVCAVGVLQARRSGWGEAARRGGGFSVWALPSPSGGV